MDVTTIELDRNFDRYPIHDIIQWCEFKFGTNNPGNWVFANPDNWYERDWAVSHTFSTFTFYFKDPEDALLFTLRWL
jgi:hypothetical protein